MRNIYKYIFSGLIIFFIIILAINGNKREYKKEESFSLRQNYNYIYSSDAKMNINLYSNLKNPSFSYLNKNTYYLCDYDEYYIIELNVDNIILYEEGDYYRFELNINIPNFSKIYIEDIYLKVVNEYHFYYFNIGSLNIVSDNYLDTVRYNSINKELEDNNLLSLSFAFDSTPNIKKILSSEALNITFVVLDKMLKINFDTKNMIKELYLIIEFTDGNLVFNNVFVNNNVITFDNNRYYMSQMIRGDISWLVFIMYVSLLKKIPF